MQEIAAAKVGAVGTSLRRAAALGAAGALGASALWFGVAAVLGNHMSALAMPVGMAVGYGVLWGARHRPGWRAQVVGGGLTLAALLVTEAFVMRLLVVRELADLGTTADLPLVLPLNVMWDLVAAGITADPPLALFWGIALWFGITLPSSRRMW